MAVWVSVSSLGLGGRFRSPRQWRCSEDLFSKAMQPLKDLDAELGVGTGLFDTEFVLRQVVPACGKTKTVGTVVVSLCSTTRGRFWNWGKSLSLVSSRYKVVLVMLIWTGDSIAELEPGLIPPGVSELSLGVGSESDMGLICAW